MEQDHLQKIQNLVNTATILSASEKNEWLQLLDLMNDRQVLELERILLDVSKSQAASIPKQPAPVQTTASLPSSSAAPAKTPPAVPKPGQDLARSPFKHIMNFPEPGAGGQSQAGPKIELVNKPKVESQTVEPTKQSPFLNKLKTMFAEKELPEPKSAHEQLLTSGSKQPPKVTTSPLPAATKLPTGPTVKLPELKPKPVQLPVQQPKPVEKPKDIEKPKPSLPVEPKKIPDKADNVTINVFVNSEQDKANLPQLLKNQGIVTDTQSAKITAEKPVAAPAALEPQKTPEVAAPKSAAPTVAAPAPAPAPLQSPRPSAPASSPLIEINQSPPRPAEQTFNIISPSQIVPEAALVKQQEVLSAARAAATAATAAATGIPKPAEKPKEQPRSGSDWNKVEPGLVNAKKDGQQPETKPSTPSAPGVAAGLNFPEGAAAEAIKSRLAGAAKTADKPQVTTQINNIMLPEKPGDNITLESLADIDQLKPEDLQQHAAGTIFKKLQKLIAQNGLHQVVFHLEKSTLYKAYINTGLTWLKDGTAVKSGPGQLTVEDFEHFADLLIVMRSRA